MYNYALRRTKLRFQEFISTFSGGRISQRHNFIKLDGMERHGGTFEHLFRRSFCFSIKPPSLRALFWIMKSEKRDAVLSRFVGDS